jgi:hypothetical protein
VIAAVITLFGLGMPVGSAGAGLLLQFFSAPHAMFVLASGVVLGAGFAGTRRTAHGEVAR